MRLLLITAAILLAFPALAQEKSPEYQAWSFCVSEKVQGPIDMGSQEPTAKLIDLAFFQCLGLQGEYTNTLTGTDEEKQAILEKDKAELIAYLNLLYGTGYEMYE